MIDIQKKKKKRYKFYFKVVYSLGEGNKKLVGV